MEDCAAGTVDENLQAGVPARDRDGQAEESDCGEGTEATTAAGSTRRAQREGGAVAIIHDQRLSGADEAAVI
jgi:hypothetical protein